MELLSSYFGDPSPSNVIVKSISDSKLVWLNKSLNYVDCNDVRYSWMRGQLLGKPETEEDGSTERRASAAVKRYFANYQLQDVSVVMRDTCLHTTPFPEVTHKTKDTIFHGMIPSPEYLMTFLIPAVIISCMLILAILLACFLHKKRKAGKLNLFYSEALPPRVPVILQDELYEENDPTVYRRHMEMADQTPDEVDRLISGTRIVMQGDGAVSSMGRPTPTYRKA